MPVAQHVGEPNEALIEWTGSRNAPVLVYDDGPPLARWQDLIEFAEAHRPTPALLPKPSQSRVSVFGIVNELAGQWGFGWCRRLMLFDDLAAAKSGAGEGVPPGVVTMMNQYRYDKASVAAAPERIADILRMLAAQLHAQDKGGSKFLVGSEPSAADIYWACFSGMLEPWPEDICPMSSEMRLGRTPTHPVVIAAKDPILLEHRNAMFRKYLGTISF